MDLQNIEIEKLEAGYNPRKNFDITELKESIKQHGILVPLVVSPFKKKFKIVSGECRWRVAKELGLKEVPCAVKELSEEEAANIAFIDNEQRNNLSPIEVAKHYAFMRDTYDKSAQQLANEYGRSQQFVDQYFQIAELPISFYHTCGKLDKRHLYALSKLIDKPALIKVFEEGLSKPFEEWNDEQKRQHNNELASREEDQLSLAARITQNELTVKQTEAEVKYLLKNYQERDRLIRMEQEEKAKHAVNRLRDGIGMIASQLENFGRQFSDFSEIATVLSHDFFKKIPENEKERLNNQLEELKDSLKQINIKDVEECIDAISQKIGVE